jgi:signal transduction histidine kinase/ActR/RegA family two-component response regulator
MDQRQGWLHRPVTAALLQTLLVGGSSAVAIFVLSVFAQRMMLDDLRNSLGQTAVTAAALIDLQAHARIVESNGQVDKAYYDRAVQPLVRLRQSNPDLRFVYTAIFRDDRVFFVLDADPKDDPRVLIEAGPYPLIAGHKEILRTQRLTIEQAPTASPWGPGIRAYAPLFDSKGHMSAFVGVTLRAERYEAALHRLQSATLIASGIAAMLALLSGAVAWRTQSARKSALEAALAASRAKSEFLATVSHEIRTPMNGVLGVADLLLLTTQTPQQRSLTDTIVRSGKSLLSIIDDILDFSKAEAGRIELEDIDFQVRNVITHVVSLFSASAQAKGLQLDESVQPDVPGWLCGDAGRLQQVLSNLVSNAIKFTDTGRVAIRCMRVPSEQRAVELRLEVEDTGVGVPAGARERIFDAFTQADGSTTRRHGGTGLGLAISSRLVALMGGKLGLDGAVAGGSIFWFTARFGVSERHVEQLAEDSAAPVDSRRGVLAGRHVLLAEDNPVNQLVATGMLEAMGAIVTVARDGREALRQLATARFSLLLIDCQMPDMDGYEATREFRRLERLSGKAVRLPIIAVTANAMPGVRDACLEAGMDDYLSKPFRLEEIERVVRQWVPAQELEERRSAAR